MKPRLRLFTGEDETFAPEPPTITMTFGELLEVIKDASRSGRTWIEDFHNDDVQIPEDLYDVLTEYRRLRPGA
ncbi:hypothetical protein AB1L42_16300 [Thalassoglobus sp. JC818]|uniref:hypothetical protein n=1 Tax=Thalassoglobus sp. JC818 TaxID=3232136 RepID=UPI003457FAC2